MFALLNILSTLLRPDVLPHLGRVFTMILPASIFAIGSFQSPNSLLPIYGLQMVLSFGPRSSFSRSRVHRIPQCCRHFLLIVFIVFRNTYQRNPFTSPKGSVSDVALQDLCSTNSMLASNDVLTGCIATHLICTS